MTSALMEDKPSIQETPISDDHEQAIFDTFDDGFEAGLEDKTRPPLVTPNPHTPATVFHAVWQLGHEHGGL